MSSEQLGPRDAYRELYDVAPVGYLTLDPRGVCVAANETAATLLGASVDELVSRPLTALFSAPEADALSRHVRATLEGDVSQPAEIALRRRDGARACTCASTASRSTETPGQSVGRRSPTPPSVTG